MCKPWSIISVKLLNYVKLFLLYFIMHNITESKTGFNQRDVCSYWLNICIVDTRESTRSYEFHKTWCCNLNSLSIFSKLKLILFPGSCSLICQEWYINWINMLYSTYCFCQQCLSRVKWWKNDVATTHRLMINNGYHLSWSSLNTQTW